MARFSPVASLAVWEARVIARKALHTKAQRDLERARMADTHPRQHLVDRRDLRSLQLAEARRMVALRKRQIRAQDKPRQFYTDHRPTGHSGALVGEVMRMSGHYSASEQDTSTKDCLRKLSGLAAYHNGKWGDWLEYHVVISVEGDIVWNRPVRLLGYGVGQHNTGTLHILMIGTTGDRPTDEQAGALRWLLENWHTEQVPPAFRAPKNMVGLPLIPHNEFSGPFGQTACPGLFKTVYKSKGLKR